MSLKSDIAAELVNALGNIRMVYSRLFIEHLLERSDNGFSPYRVYRVSDNTPVTSFDDFVALINENTIAINFTISTPSSFSNMAKPIRVRVTGVRVVCEENAPADQFFTVKYGTDFDSIEFLFGYAEDGDPSMALQIFDVYLLKA